MLRKNMPTDFGHPDQTDERALDVGDQQEEQISSLHVVNLKTMPQEVTELEIVLRNGWRVKLRETWDSGPIYDWRLVTEKGEGQLLVMRPAALLAQRKMRVERPDSIL
jgi:hypothetical protein